MKPTKIIIAALLSLSFLSSTFAATAPKPPANTLAVTPAGAALGFTLTPIVSSVPIVAKVGSIGVVAAKNGDIVVTNFNDDVVRVYSNSDVKNGSKLKYTSTITGIRGSQLASLNASIYATIANGTAYSIVQLNDNGTLAKTILSNMPISPNSLVAAPAINSLVFGSATGSGFFITTAPNGGAQYNGLAPSPAYFQLYSGTEGGTSNAYFDCCSRSVYSEALAYLERFSLSGTSLTQNLHLYLQGGGWDGAGYGIGKIGGNTTLNGMFIINNRFDALIVNPDTNERTTILSGGNYEGERVSPYPDGSLLITSGNTIFKLRCGAGCSFL